MNFYSTRLSLTRNWYLKIWHWTTRKHSLPRISMATRIWGTLHVCSLLYVPLVPIGRMFLVLVSKITWSWSTVLIPNLSRKFSWPTSVKKSQSVTLSFLIHMTFSSWFNRTASTSFTWSILMQQISTSMTEMILATMLWHTPLGTPSFSTTKKMSREGIF